MTKFKNLIGEIGYSGLIVILACGLTVLQAWKLDNDTWFILNCGRYVTETGTIPHTEFATMHEGLHYVMEQWLTAVIFWKIYSNFGVDGLIFFAWAVGFILIFVYYKLCLYVSDGNKKISVMLSCIIGGFISITFLVTRPQILSTLILLTEIFLLEKFSREKKFWTLCTLPILAVIFINLHAALFPMLIVVMLPFIAESLIQKIKPARSFEIPLKPLIFAAVGIFLAGFINPYGWEAITFVFTSYDPEIHGGIQEVQVTSAGHLTGVMFFIFSALLIIAFTKKALPLRYFFLSFGIMILGFMALRNIFLFLALATFPLAFAAKDLKLFDNVFNLKYRQFIPLFLICAAEIVIAFVRGENFLLTVNLSHKVIFISAIIFFACFIFFYRREGKLFDEEIFILRRKPLIAFAVLQSIILLSICSYAPPKKSYQEYKPALDYLLENNRAEDIILWTGFNSGGYAEFRGVKNYIDARPEIFALSNNHKKDIIREYFSLHSGKLDYKEFFARYNFTHIFITTEDIIPYLMLSQDKNYRLLFEYDLPNGKGHGRIFQPIKSET